MVNKEREDKQNKIIKESLRQEREAYLLAKKLKTSLMNKAGQSLAISQKVTLTETGSKVETEINILPVCRIVKTLNNDDTDLIKEVSIDNLEDYED